MEKSLAAFLLLLASATASPAFIKRYRPDYTYNVKTDAFYKLHTKSATVQQARLQCQSEGATLMESSSVYDLQQQYRMIQLNLDVGDVVIGVDEDILDSKITLDLDSSEEFYDTLYYLPQSKIMTPDGQIKTSSCDLSRPYFCKVNAMEVPYNAKCDVLALGYTYDKSTDSCYKISPVKAKWDEARARCEAEGAHLVVLRNEQEFEVVKTLVQNVPNDVEDWQFFVGVSAEKTFDDSLPVFKTIFGETLEEVGYAAWGEEEPSNTFGVEYCGSILKRTGEYNDTVCRNMYSFICQKKVTQTANDYVTEDNTI